jgi:ATP-dependent Clp protease ATP-binding subunit ClpA
MFERFTDRARRVVVAAQEEARMLGHNHIGSEHLLLGLLHEQDGTAAQVLASAGITAEAARAQVEEFAGPGSKSPSGHIPFTQRARKVLELSLREALERNSRHIGTEHILLALMRNTDDVGAQILERLGGSLPALREQVLKAASEAAAPAPAEGEGGPEAAAWEWRPPGLTRETRAEPQAITGLRNLLTPIDRRLAGIERHLGITADEEAAGFRGLLASVNRRLANIERHVGITAGEEAREAGEESQEVGEETREGDPAAAEE